MDGFAQQNSSSVPPIYVAFRYLDPSSGASSARAFVHDLSPAPVDVAPGLLPPCAYRLQGREPVLPVQAWTACEL